MANGNIEAIQKYDVTDDFNRILPVEPIASTDVQYGVRFRDKETRPLSKEAACALAAWMPDSFTVATREIRQGPWQVQP